VYQALDIENEKDVAIKVISKRVLEDDSKLI